MGFDVKKDWNKIRTNFRQWHLFVEKGLRGGISYICKRFSEANNKDMKNNDPTKPSKYIMYLDKATYMDGQWVDIFGMVDLSG